MKDAIRCVTDEPNLQVSNLAHLGQKLSELSAGINAHVGSEIHLVLQCSLSSYLLYPPADFTELGNNPAE